MHWPRRAVVADERFRRVNSHFPEPILPDSCLFCIDDEKYGFLGKYKAIEGKFRKNSKHSLYFWKRIVFVMRKYLHIVLVLLCFVPSCKKEDAKPVDWAEYYPLAIGTTRIYECTKITIDVPADIRDTATFLLRETVKSLISETKNCRTFAENCEIKEEGSSEWKPYFSLSVQQYDHAVVRVKDNVPLQVLKFPAKMGFTWDLNEFNTFDNNEFHIRPSIILTMTQSMYYGAIQH